ncbi:MAG TPA: ABC transporter substrate-binding protein [Actinomycetota bacterium]|nr:ABC transporter substrate-binding protein [Actinomycetota bacterium]
MRRLAATCALALAASACTDSEPPARPPSELRVGVRTVGSLDPLAVEALEGERGETLVRRQIFEGLVSHDPRTLEPKPGLASGWTVSPDARTFTFLLRKDVRFHDGTPVKASDVVFSLSRLARAACAPEASPTRGAPSYLLSLVVGYPDVAGGCKSDILAGVAALGDSTVSIALSEPWADFPSVLGHPAASVVPEAEIRSEHRQFGEKPVGTGPYTVAEAWDGGGMRLEAFGGYWGRQPAIRRVRVIGTRDEAGGYLDLLQGKLHYASVPANRARQARRKFGDDGFARTTGLYFFGFNLRSARGMKMLAFRQGLSMAADRSGIASAIFEGTRDPALGLTSPALPGGRARPCAAVCLHDADAARAKIAEAFPDGPPEITIGVPEEGSNPAVGEALAKAFGAAGVTARVVKRPVLDHVKGLDSGDLDLFQFGWVPAYPAADGLLFPLFASTARDNFMRYANPEVDRLLAEARRTVEPGDRVRRFAKAEEAILADLPVLPLLWYRSSAAMDLRLRASGGPAVDGLGLTNFARLSFGRPRETS